MAGLADAVADEIDREVAIAERRKRIEAVVGIWKDRLDGKSTDEIMLELRGDD